MTTKPATKNLKKTIIVILCNVLLAVAHFLVLWIVIENYSILEHDISKVARVFWTLGVAQGVLSIFFIAGIFYRIWESSKNFSSTSESRRNVAQKTCKEKYIFKTCYTL